jgi:hypothetical protein
LRDAAAGLGDVHVPQSGALSGGNGCTAKQRSFRFPDPISSADASDGAATPQRGALDQLIHKSRSLARREGVLERP